MYSLSLQIIPVQVSQLTSLQSQVVDEIQAARCMQLKAIDSENTSITIYFACQQFVFTTVA